LNDWLAPDLVRKLQRTRATLAAYCEADRGAFTRGLDSLADGDSFAATRAFDEILARDRKNALAYFFRAMSYRQRGDYSSALNDLGRAVRLDPQDADAFAARALSRWDRYLAGLGAQVSGVPPSQEPARDLNRVISDCNAAIRLDPAHARAFLLRARADHRKRHLARALLDYTQAIALDVIQKAEAFAGRGEIHRLTGYADLAIADLNEAVRHDASNAEYLGERGKAYELKGDRARARGDFETAIRLDPANKPLLESATLADPMQAPPEIATAAGSAAPQILGVAEAPLGTGDLALGEPTFERRTWMVGNPDAAPFKNFQDFWERGELFHSPGVLVYPVTGCPGTTIAVPDAEADYDRLTAQEVLTLLRALPDIRLVRRITVIDRPFRYQPWFAQLNPKWRLLGEVVEGNEVVLYRPVAGDEAAATVAHEWAHLLEFAAPKWRRLFELVGDLETFIGRPHQEEPPKEQWARLGEFLLSTTPLLSPSSAWANPIRATIFVRALAERLACVPPELCSTEAAYYGFVLAWDRDTTRPEAVQRLKSIAAGTRTERAVRAQLILNVLGES
jgi:tetratricopeptide (TPR) repeat protein